MAYRLDLSLDMSSIYPVFHVSMLRKLIGEPSSIVPLGGIGVRELNL